MGLDDLADLDARAFPDSPLNAFCDGDVQSRRFRDVKIIRQKRDVADQDRRSFGGRENPVAKPEFGGRFLPGRAPPLARSDPDIPPRLGLGVVWVGQCD